MKHYKLTILLLLQAFVFTTLLQAQSNYQLYAGKNQTILLGETVTLNGIVKKGDKNTIIEYRWEELGNVLKDGSNDPIVYEDYAQGEYAYKATKIGHHRLTFKAKDNQGNVYEDSFILNVEEMGSGEYVLDVGFDRAALSITLGNFVKLQGSIKQGDESQIEEYRWEKDGQVIKNMAGDEIRYYDKVNRFNDYKPTKEGRENLDFIVITKDGKRYQKQFRLYAKQVQKRFRLGISTKSKIKLGEFVTLNGTVIEGNKSEIEYYYWEEKEVTLKNMLGDEILYYDEANRLNDYKPKTTGRHILKFVAHEFNGAEYGVDFALQVDNMTIEAGAPVTITLGETVKLEGKVIEGNTSNVLRYEWRKVRNHRLRTFKDINNKESIYVEGDDPIIYYKPIIYGLHYFYFVVTTKAGNELRDIKKVSVIPQVSPDDYGDTPETATDIAINTVIRGKLNSLTDHDYFRFTLNKAQFMYPQFSTSCRKKYLSLADSDLNGISLQYGAPGGHGVVINKKILLQAGSYYLDVHPVQKCSSPDYSINITTDDIVVGDDYGNDAETASTVSLNSIIEGVISPKTDKDYFKFTATENGTVVLKRVPGFGLARIPSSIFVRPYKPLGYRVAVKAGQTYYFSVSPRHFYPGDQERYKLSLTFTK